MKTPPVKRVARLAWRSGLLTGGERLIPEESAIAFTYDGGSYAVMMATPQDLEDFAVGFSLSEGIISSPRDIRDIEIVEEDIGIELRMWLSATCATALSDRRRHMAGPTGCGLCGIESLTEALRPVRQVRDGQHFAPADIMRAVDAMSSRQELNLKTRATHAAGFWQAGKGLVAVREDVGRHNALDKLGGALAGAGVSGHGGMAVLTSRVSVEMVQKAAIFGIPVIVAVSAPTALAVRTAELAGITLIAIARSDGFEIFTHQRRITTETAIHVA